MKGDEKMESKKKGLDREMIVVCGLAALLISISIIFSVALWMNLDLLKCNSTILVAVFSVLTGGIWGILLCRNC